MSVTTLYGFDGGGVLVSSMELRNSHGTGPHVWRKLCEKYYGSRHAWLTSEYKDGPIDRLFRRAEANDLPADERVALLLTADGMLIGRAEFSQVADALDRGMPQDGDGVNHWPTIAQWLRDALKDERIASFGMHGTSMSEDSFCIRDEESKEEEVTSRGKTIQTLFTAAA